MNNDPSFHKQATPGNQDSSPENQENNGVNQGIKARMETIREEIQSKRFLGQDPLIEISPGEQIENLLAKFQVAHDLNIPLVWDHHQYFPGEKQAQAFFYSGIASLNFWNFSQASDRFECAGRLTRNSLLAQRTTLFQYLLVLIQALLDTGPYRKLDRKIIDQAQQVLRQLDLIPSQEKEHYQKEIQRLEDLAQKLMQGDLPTNSLWYFIRAYRYAKHENECLAALLWLVALDSYLTRHQVPMEKTEYLTQLLLEARQSFKLLLGFSLEKELGDLPQPSPTGTPRGRKSTPQDFKFPSFWDLYDAFVPVVNKALGLDVQHDIAQFRVQPFIPPPNIGEEDE